MNLCFSTEAVDLDNQAPNRNRRESRYFWDELNHLIAAGGFCRIEIPYEPKWDFGGRSGIPRTKRSMTTKFGTVAGYAAFLRENGITGGIACIHMNPSLFASSGILPMYLGASKHYAEEAVETAAEAGCGIVTLTATPPYFASGKLIGDGTEEDFLAAVAGVIGDLAAYAGEKGVTLCVKNEYWSLVRGEKIHDFVEKLPASVMLDVDTANLKIAGADPAEMIRKCAGRIGVVHITDTAFTDTEEAWKTALPEYPPAGATKVFRDPGDGEIDFSGIAAALEETGYDGLVVFNPKDSCDISRSILRSRWFADHVFRSGATVNSAMTAKENMTACHSAKEVSGGRPEWNRI